MKIVVKVGTQSILSDSGEPVIEQMQMLAGQIATLQRQKHHVVLVSSGAVGFGRGLAERALNKTYGSSIGEKQLLASLGQPELMRLYSQLFSQYGIVASQLLLTKQDFYTRQHYLNIARLIKEILMHDNIIPVINENDSVAIQELMFTDNDELAGLIAAQINADKLIILSNVEGVYTKHPHMPGAELITCIHPQTDWPDISSEKSMHGRGGMISKLSTAKKMARLGITTHIASVNQPNIIQRLVAGESIGTTIVAHRKKSEIKRWVAYSSPTGKIVVNHGLYEILTQQHRVTSILPIGVESYSGHFVKGDIVEIVTPDHQRIGIGIAKYDAQLLTDFIGKKNKPALIHYDHLYIF